MRQKAPDIEAVRLVYDLAEQGASLATIRRETGGYSYERVTRWLENPAKYDPYIDEVAVARAIGGDIEVLRNLTLYEQDEMSDRLIRMSKTNPDAYLDLRSALFASLGKTEWRNVFNRIERRGQRAAATA